MQWLVADAEPRSGGDALAMMLKRAAEEEGPGSEVARFEVQVAMLARCEVAPDKITPRVSLFPLPGVTPGLAGLLRRTPARRSSRGCGRHDRAPRTGQDHRRRVQPQAGAGELRRGDRGGGRHHPRRDNVQINPTSRPF